ncbi:lipopolysaccharide assembly protein LapA domain-containing protein [Thalassotalea euphylliae]|uniref:lipopolysaccharide assembly protein LapA domain-containing protein n=1 Tax=Thalassotalea euphylliae TaxID=1655234 RepID=UPI003627CF3F
MKLYLTIIAMFFLLILAFVFGSQNEQVITLNYLIAKTSMPIAMAVSLFMTLGFFLGLLFVLMLKLLKPFKRQSNKS